MAKNINTNTSIFRKRGSRSEVTILNFQLKLIEALLLFFKDLIINNILDLRLFLLL